MRSHARAQMKVLPRLSLQERFATHTIIALQFAHIALLLAKPPHIENVANNALSLLIYLHAILSGIDCAFRLVIRRMSTFVLKDFRSFFRRQSELLIDESWQIRLSNWSEGIGYIAIEEIFRFTHLELEFGWIVTPIVACSHSCQCILKKRLLHQKRPALLDNGTDPILHHVLQCFGVGFTQIALDLLQAAPRLLQRRNKQVIADLQRRIELVAVLRLRNRHQKPDILVMAQRFFRSIAKVSEFTCFEQIIRHNSLLIHRHLVRMRDRRRPEMHSGSVPRTLFNTFRFSPLRIFQPLLEIFFATDA